MRATQTSPPVGAGPASPLARTRGIDHCGVTVDDLDEALADIRALGGGLCYVEGPIREPHPGWMTRKLGARGPYTLRVATVNVLGANLELFVYDGAGSVPPAPAAGTPGSFFLLLRTPDPAATASRLGLERGADEDGFAATLPSGLHIVVREGDPERLCGGVCLPPADYQSQLQDLRDLFGLRRRGEISAYGLDGVVLAADTGAEIAVLRATGPGPRPANSDPGGHHIAFHADDVDGSCAALAAVNGYRPFGEPETITDGPIAGDRWIYIGSPSGLQLELINMPDGTLPYESDADWTRTPIGTTRPH